MSWAAIRGALVTRLGTITGIENVHGQIRYVDDNLEETIFKDLFVDTNNNVNTWMFSRTARAVEAVPDDSTKAKVLHTVTMQGSLSLVDAGTGSANTEDTFQGLIDALCDDLRTGDRTLGGVANTHSLPQASTIGHAMFYRSVLCHDTTVTLTIEEIVSV